MSQTSRLDKLLAPPAHSMPDTGPVLALRATDNSAYSRVSPEQLHPVQSYKPTSDKLQHRGLFPRLDMPQSATAAIVELTRSKPENLANIAKAYGVLNIGATLYIDGAKTDGIDSILKAVKKIMPLDGTYSKAHGKTLWLSKTGPDNPFAAWIKLADTTKNKDGFYTTPGIFSADAIDPASALLCQNITRPLTGKGADLGAGWGTLSHYALQTYPGITHLDLYEAEHISLDCARKNITDARAELHWQDVQTLTTKTVYDFILMNPPFHTSRKADPSLGRDFIVKAAQMLAPKGHLWMVANKQLAYEAALDNCFHTWSYEIQTTQYKIIHARRPK
ncbi:MAG: methyltransferase [Rhodobacterales bacterium]